MTIKFIVTLYVLLQIISPKIFANMPKLSINVESFKLEIMYFLYTHNHDTLYQTSTAKHGSKKKLNEKKGKDKTGDSMVRKILLVILLLVVMQLFASQRSMELEREINSAMGREKVDLLLELAKEVLEEDIVQSWEADSLALVLAKASRYRQGERRALILAGRIELNRQNYWKAIDYFDEALSLIETKTEILDSGIIKINQAQAYSKLGWSDKAKNYLEEAETQFLSLETNDKVLHELVMCYLIWGTIELELGNFETSLEKLLKGMQEVEKIQELELEAVIKGNIGRVYQSLMNPALSLKYYRQSLEVHKKLDNKSEMAVVFGNMGTLYSELEDYDKALEYYTLSLETYEKLGNLLGVSQVLGNIANLYYFKGDFNTALEYYHQEDEILSKLSASIYHGFFKNNLGMTYLELGKYKQAEASFQEALNIAREVGSHELEAVVYSSLAELLIKEGNYQEALRYNRKQAALKDSIFAETTASQIAEMQTKYDTERKERENKLLRKDNEIKELEIGKKEMQRNSLFIIVGLLIILAIFVYNRYRTKKRSAEILATKNELITKQKEILSETLDELKRTQKQLVESEKMASLGNLVTGVAHEINTPVGIIITAITNLNDRLQSLIKKFKANQMKKSDLDSFLDYTDKVGKLILSNSQRTDELVKSFKKVSVDQSSETKRQFNLRSYIKDVLMSLEPKFKNKEIEIEINCDEFLIWNSYPGILAQIITNLVINSIVHGFDKKKNGKITFEIKRENEILNFVYSDFGKGMPQEVVDHIFDPFFTTNKQTGTGLGMHIIYNLITQKLKGTIEVESELGKGSEFKMEFPFTEGGLSDL